MDSTKKPVVKSEKAQPKKGTVSHAPRVTTPLARVEYFKDIVATIREPLVVLDAGLRVLAANRSFYKFFKVKAGETIGQLVYDLGNQQWDNPALRALLETNLSKKAVCNDFEMEHEFPGIGRRILLLNARKISTLPKEAQWILLAFEDVTERMQLERALQASEKQFHAVFETASACMLLVDKISGQVLNSNRAARDLLGYSKQKLLKKNLWELGILKDRRQFRRISLKLEEKGVVGLVDTTIPTSKGGNYPADITIMDRSEVIQCNIRENTERKQAEEVLREIEERYRLVFEYSGTANTLYDTECRVILQNSLSKKLTEPMDALGKTALEVFGPEQGRVVTERMRRVLASGKPETFETEFVLPAGTKWIYSAYQPLMNQQNAISGVQVISQDITEHRHLELVQDVIYRITQTANTSEGIDELYHSIHSILGELIPAENFYIALIDPATKLLRFPYYVDQFDEPPTGMTQIQGLTGYVIRSGRPLLATREIFDRLVQQGEVEAVGTAGVDWMGAPLRVEGRIMGAMAVQSYTQGIHFSQADLNLLELVSTQVAQSIERKRLEEELRSLSLTDELTGLYNRRGFTLLAEHEMKLAHRLKRTMLLFFGDVDDLKTINDTHGHAQGDLALKEVSALLKETFREMDISARLGGDEFVVLAVDASMESADILINRIQSFLEKGNQQGDWPYQLSLSMGIAHYDPESPCTINEMIAQADGQMYLQKQAKKGKQ